MSAKWICPFNLEMLRLVNDRWAVFQSIFWKVRAFATAATHKKIFFCFRISLEIFWKVKAFATGATHKKYFSVLEFVRKCAYLHLV